MNEKNDAREPVVAGSFYDENPKYLKEDIEEYIKDFKGSRKIDTNIEKSCLGVVSPHAGYVFSGRTAVQAISCLMPAKTFIVLGPNHSSPGSSFAVWGSGEWKTPLGEVIVDSTLANELKDSCSILKEDKTVHMKEHSIEVQLPIMQQCFGDNVFSIVPISIMNADYSNGFQKDCEKLGNAIASLFKTNKIGIIASSDFSHYVPQDIAKQRDDDAINYILNLDVKGFFQSLEQNDGSVCGYGPIAVLMSISKVLGLKARLISGCNSGDVTGDNRSVVAYHAIGFQ